MMIGSRPSETVKREQNEDEREPSAKIGEPSQNLNLENVKLDKTDKITGPLNNNYTKTASNSNFLFHREKAIIR